MTRIRPPADSARRYRIRATAWVLAYAAGAVFLAVFSAQIATNPEAGDVERVFAIAFAVLTVLLVALAGLDLAGIWRKRGGGQ